MDDQSTPRTIEQGLVQLIELAATAPTVDPLETMFDVVGAMCAPDVAFKLNTLIYERITAHAAF